MIGVIRDGGFQPQRQYPWLKGDQRGQILVFEFQLGNFIGSTHDLAFAILHLGLPALGIWIP